MFPNQCSDLLNPFQIEILISLNRTELCMYSHFNFYTNKLVIHAKLGNEWKEQDRQRVGEKSDSQEEVSN